MSVGRDTGGGDVHFPWLSISSIEGIECSVGSIEDGSKLGVNLYILQDKHWLAFSICRASKTDAIQAFEQL